MVTSPIQFEKKIFIISCKVQNTTIFRSKKYGLSDTTATAESGDVLEELGRE